jgi:bifunctional DNase/RNase
VYFIPAFAERDKIEEIIDARTSDAITALRFNAPIFTYKNIF